MVLHIIVLHFMVLHIMVFYIFVVVTFHLFFFFLFPGRAITDAIIRMGGYDSISGNYVRIDENGDSEGNFTAFALRR